MKNFEGRLFGGSLFAGRLFRTPRTDYGGGGFSRRRVSLRRDSRLDGSAGRDDDDMLLLAATMAAGVGMLQ